MHFLKNYTPLITSGMTALFCLLHSSSSFSHPGGLDSKGGHVDKKTGGYHCHKFCDKASSSSTANKKTSKNIGEKHHASASKEYDRHDWKHWSDLNHDCMNTRHDVLQRYSIARTKLSANGCSVVSGVWEDPFSGLTFYKASDVDIDHIIPLKWASDHGGISWSAAEKERFANDMENLLAVQDNLNQEKGAKGPDEWMPPNAKYRCTYLQRWDTLLHKYSGLKMSVKEDKDFKKRLSSCR